VCERLSSELLESFSVIFPLILTEFYVLTIRWNRIIETIPTNGNNIEIG